MDNTINKITGSTADITSKLLTIAEHHIGDLTGNTDFLRSGAASAIIEQMALVLRDSTIHKNMLYNESFLNTAVIPKSIYNWAKMFNINVTNATPAQSKIDITMKVTELDSMINKRTGNSSVNVKYGSDVSNESGNVFVIDRSNSFIADDYEFSLERSIMITNNNGRYQIKYITTESKTTEYLPNNNIYLKYNITSLNGEEYITITVDVVQYKVNVTKKQITSSSFTDTKIHNFTFTEQLAGMTLNYSKNNSITNIDLLYTTVGSTSTNKNFGIYSLLDANTIQVKFYNDYFLPTVGGTLEFTTYTTKGTGGNINYIGEVVFSLKDEDYRTLAISSKFSDGIIYGGVDSPSLNEIKSVIINEISTRDVIVTESDLNSYFKSLKTLFESINSGKLEFIKKRADIIKRTFNSYVLMREQRDFNEQTITDTTYLPKVIPTNTVDVTFPITANISKPFGSLVREVYNNGQITYEYIPDELTIGENSYYVIPFYMRIMLSPFKKVKYIYNLTNESTTLNIRSLDSNSTFLANTVSIYRGMTNVIDNKYKLEFSFTTSEEMKSTDNISLILYKTENSPTELKVDSTNISITSTQNDTLYENIISVDLEISEDEFNFDNVNDFGSFISVKVGDSTMEIPEQSFFGLKLDNYTLGTEKLSMECKSNDTLTTFKNLDNIMSSDIIINSNDTEITSITIKEIPVVHSSFFGENIDKLEAFISQMLLYMDILINNMGKLETNTSFNLKFINTYGPSLKFNTVSTNIDLELTIWLYEDNINIQEEIRDYIRVLIDRSNVEGSLKVSKIISLVSTAYNKYIDHIDFEGLNGTFNQYIESIESNAINPEYFTLDGNKLESSIKFEII